MLSEAEAQAILKRISYHGFKFTLRYGFNGLIFRIEQKVVNSEDCKTEIELFMSWALDEEYSGVLLDEQHFVRFVWKCCQERVLHEAGEFFRVDGIAPYHPHAPSIMPAGSRAGL